MSAIRELILAVQENPPGISRGGALGSLAKRAEDELNCIESSRTAMYDQMVRMMPIKLMEEIRRLESDHTESEKALIDTVLKLRTALEYALKAFEVARAEGLLGGSPEADEEFEENMRPIREALR